MGGGGCYSTTHTTHQMCTRIQPPASRAGLHQAVQLPQQLPFSLTISCMERSLASYCSSRYGSKEGQLMNIRDGNGIYELQSILRLSQMSRNSKCLFSADQNNMAQIIKLYMGQIRSDFRPKHQKQNRELSITSSHGVMKPKSWMLYLSSQLLFFSIRHIHT